MAYFLLHTSLPPHRALQEHSRTPSRDPPVQGRNHLATLWQTELESVLEYFLLWPDRARGLEAETTKNVFPLSLRCWWGRLNSAPCKFARCHLLVSLLLPDTPLKRMRGGRAKKPAYTNINSTFLAGELHKQNINIPSPTFLNWN